MPTAVQAKAQLKRLAPQFLVLNLDASAAFYTEKLGFTVEFAYGDFYVSVQRDGVTLHLKLSDDPEPGRAFKKQGEHLDAYIETDDVESLFSEYKQRGVAFLQALHTTSWGTNEFVIEDTDGYILFFSQRV